MKSQRNDLEQSKKDAISQLKAEYQKLKEAQASLQEQYRQISGQLDEKQNGLDDRNNENIQLINNELSLLRNKEGKIKENTGLSIAKETREKLDALFQQYDTIRQTAYGAGNAAIANETKSLDLISKRIEDISKDLNEEKLKEMISKIEAAQSVTEIQQRIVGVFPATELAIRMIQGSINGLTKDIKGIDVRLTAPAAPSQLCKEEMEKQQSILRALGMLAFIDKWKDSTDDYVKTQLFLKIDELQDWCKENKSLANLHVIFDENTKQSTSINHTLHKILESSVMNKENINAGPQSHTTDDLLKKQQAGVIDAKKDKPNYEKLQKYNSLILLFKEYEKSLKPGSNRLKSAETLRNWLIEQRNKDTTGNQLQATFDAMEKRIDYQNIVESKMKVSSLFAQSPERTLRTKLAEFKTTAFRVSQPSEPSKPASSSEQRKSSTHAQIIKTLPAQQGSRPSSTNDDDLDFSQILANLQEASKAVSSQQPKPPQSASSKKDNAKPDEPSASPRPGKN